jgi:ParB family chromosome partitioning protein
MSKKPPRRVLGRGLAALIPAVTEEPEARENSITEIACSAIKPNPFQPRTDFNEEEIKSLAESIRSQGLLQPILVRQKGGNEYEIVSGERRFRATQELGRATIPCIVRQKLSDREMREVALVENIQREDLNEMEKAEAYQKLIIEYGYTHDQLSKQLGKSRTVVTNSLRLLNLPLEVQQLVRKNAVSAGHARALLSVEDNQYRIELARKIVDEGLSVREVEKRTQSAVQQKKGKEKTATDEKTGDPDVLEALRRLEYHLGTRVRLKGLSENKGRLEIDYFSEKDLARIFDLLLAEKQRQQP